jgi:hypothetical protein
MDSSDNDRFGPTSDIVNKVRPDIFVRCEGTIFLFEPLTVAAKQWICENVQPDARWFGNALAVEWCYAAELAAGMRKDGFVLA